MTWREGVAAWRDFDKQHPGPWWAGVVTTVGGGGLAFLAHSGRIATSPGVFAALVAVVALLAIVFGRRLFWNDGERRLRALFRLAGFIVIGRLLGELIKWSGLVASRQEMFAGGSRTMFLGTLVALTLGTVTCLIAVRLLDRRPVRELGIVPEPGFWGDFAFGLALGVILMGVVFTIERLAGWVHVTQLRLVKPPDVSFVRGILYMGGVFVAVGFYEELVSRGYILRTLAQGFLSRWISPQAAIAIGVGLSSLLFGMGHFGNPNATWVSTVNIMIAGVLLALPFVLTGRLAGSIGLHITWNFFQGCVFGFPVSGLAAPVSLLAVEQGGPAAWTGGAFGPEAGIVGLIAMALGAALIVGRERWRNGRASFETALVEGRGPRVYVPAA